MRTQKKASILLFAWKKRVRIHHHFYGQTTRTLLCLAGRAAIHFVQSINLFRLHADSATKQHTKKISQKPKTARMMRNFGTYYEYSFYYHHCAIYLVLFVIMLGDLGFALTRELVQRSGPNTGSRAASGKSWCECRESGVWWGRRWGGRARLRELFCDEKICKSYESINFNQTSISHLISGLAAASTSLCARSAPLPPWQKISKSAWCSPRCAAPISWRIHSPCLLYCSISILSVWVKMEMFSLVDIFLWDFCFDNSIVYVKFMRFERETRFNVIVWRWESAI